MHAGRSYSFVELILWTRRTLYLLVAFNLLVVVLYQAFGLKWLAVPWGVVLMIGITAALTLGLKSLQTCHRMWEAQQVWASIAATSRAWASMSRDFLQDEAASRRLVYRHLAWLTALRYQMRDSKAWERLKDAPNAEYRKHYAVPEKETALGSVLGKYVSPAERNLILAAGAKAAPVLGMQSADLKAMFDAGQATPLAFVEMQSMIRRFHQHQASSERIKNHPFPRQYAIVNRLLVITLCVLLPFGMVSEMEPLNGFADGAMAGRMVWLAVPVSVLVSWVYAALHQVGESSENPFEGGANDVPISQVCAAIEDDLRRELGETGVPDAAAPTRPIVL